ncbi:class I SAM-dependent methyltransferase [Paenibacillus marinisediminis]
MLACFQQLFVNPADGHELEYTGTYRNGNWDNGFLKSTDHEWQVINGVPYFDSDREGDQFSQEDIDYWTKGGRFQRRWMEKDNKVETPHDVYHSLCQKAADLNLPIMDIACGPGMGLLPDIVAKNPDIPCLATDACSSLILHWHKFMIDNHIISNISFASFDAANMPIRSNSVDVITSYIGFSSSLRSAGADGMKGIHEAYRVLTQGGYIFAIESAWQDRTALREVYRLWGRDYRFNDHEMSWYEKFEKAGFRVLEEKPQLVRLLTPQDNDLGEAAAKFGIEIGLEYTAYVVQKV